MRSIILAASVALALSGLDTRAATAGAPAVSSPSVSTASSPGASTSTSTTSTSSIPAGSPVTPANAGAANNINGTPNSATGTDINNSQPRFGPGSSFANDGGNSALGTSAGQTSSGTLVGNSGSGLNVGSTATLGTGTNGSTAIMNPDGTVSLAGSGSAPATMGVPINNAAQPGPSYTILNTPLLDQAAREGRAREAARRARGETPRIYGIAPNTDNDLTRQMPDDRIIRY